MKTLIKSIRQIKLRYIGSWLKDQLGRPDWFRNMVVNRSAWGAFSFYAHARRSDEKSKIAYSSKAKAEKAAFDMTKKYGTPFTVYKCLFCEGWHVSRAVAKDAQGKTTEQIALEKNAVKADTRLDGLDVERIMSTGIPDLAQVYGGFRGRALSSPRQLPAWKMLIKSGVNQIIDLRGDYTSDFYKDLCKESGISYFKYPVAYKDEYIASMVKLFPTFCELIDKGRFYIHCAHGLHRTDIALSTYWVFYAADKGIAPPPICGYRKDKGLTTLKIMRVLNAVYKYMTETNGVEPIPENVFLERKEIINDLSRNSENVVRNDSHPEKRRMSEEERRIANRSKKLSFLLRHDKDYPFGEHGWREVSDMMENHGFTMEELNQIVATNNKQRFEFSEDKTRIRARQGHSIEVDVELEETTSHGR